VEKSERRNAAVSLCAAEYLPLWHRLPEHPERRFGKSCFQLMFLLVKYVTEDDSVRLPKLIGSNF
jgi:hypothetical protein